MSSTRKKSPAVRPRKTPSTRPGPEGGARDANRKARTQAIARAALELFLQRGVEAVSVDDVVRRAVIMALMCQGELQFESIELAHLIDFRSYFATELETLQTLQEQGLATVHSTDITVTEQGWFFIRAVAMVFDRYLQADRNRARFSRII